MNRNYSEYLRSNQLPSVWCPGCGNGVIVKALLTAIDELGYRKDQILVISGIGCSGRTPFILDFNTMHTTHGRALAFATGVRLTRPDLKIIVVMGDGDASAIGGNHLIHAARRNIELTALVFNNSIYGQTGGQLAPTTPAGKYSTTTQLGNIEPAFDLVRLACGAGASFVARTTSVDFLQMVSYIRKALTHRGFALLDILTCCPTYFGRLNELREPYAMLGYLRESTVPLCDPLAECADVASFAPTGGANLTETGGAPLPTGVFVDEQRPEYTQLYAEVCAQARQRWSEP
jgi:2-oxoglutarate ferredoxin oxidoreductase subunit beta